MDIIGTMANYGFGTQYWIGFIVLVAIGFFTWIAIDELGKGWRKGWRK